MKVTKLFVFALIAVVAAIAATTVGLAAITTPAVLADCDSVVVIESDVARQPHSTPPTRNWVVYTTAAGTGTFRSGPGTPPAGGGSFETSTPLQADKVTIFNFDHVGTELADIDKMSYATYRTVGIGVALPSINIQVDFNGAAPGGFTTLVFEPYFNPDQGAIQNDTWQMWDAYNGGQALWWSTRVIPGVSCVQCPVTWDTIVAANPDATILGGYGINQGTFNPGIVASSDVLTLGSNGECITYNFELFRVATTGNQCKNGGYTSVRRADGSSFKNQGDCMQYVNTGK